MAIDMNASFNSTMTRADTEDVLHLVNDFRESPIVCTFIAVALAAIALSGFENGRKALQRFVWLLDRMLGGAPHTVTLPGPSGLPLLGNLTHVSYSWISRLDSSDCCI